MPAFPDDTEGAWPEEPALGHWVLRLARLLQLGDPGGPADRSKTRNRAELEVSGAGAGET